MKHGTFMKYGGEGVTVAERAVLLHPLSGQKCFSGSQVPRGSAAFRQITPSS